MPIQRRKSTSTAIGRGLRRRCPACGQGHAFAGYLRVVDQCSRCGEALGHIRADDFPPYLTIVLVGHLVVPTVLLTEQTQQWSMTTNMIVWPAVTLALCLAFLPFLKGGVLGLMWSLGLNGRERQGSPSL
ncbi:MAG: DUF983 domain-containing protein [Alphaproteobacteria bacterium]|nr:DUF983 domain-containing protein [Alphaproteobacteria bacterium]MCB9928320.1 DUF983 domain-containing protein [Alphaproteobacteria bacterium]